MRRTALVTRHMPRRLLGLGAAGAALAVWASCSTRIAPDAGQGDEPAAGERGRLTARPRPPTEPPYPPGLHPLGLGAGRDGLVYVPTGYHPDRPAPLVVMLHGAGGNARDGLGPFLALADEAGLLMVAPESRGTTWNMLAGDHGADVAFVNRALDHVFHSHAVQPEHVAVGGFSDGASYALSVGLSNGDLFGHVIAFSPGFAAPARRHGSPRVFLSHGTRDFVLPVASTSGRIVPRLRRERYDLLYREFDGAHTVPPEIAREALRWFLGGPA